MHQFGERPEDCLAGFVLLLDPGLNEEMHVVRHHAGGKKLEPVALKMPEGIKDNRAGLSCQHTVVAGCDGDSVDRPGFLEMREAAAFGICCTGGGWGRRDAYPTLIEDHRRKHALCVIGQMPTRLIHFLPGKMRGADTHVAGGKLGFLRQFF